MDHKILAAGLLCACTEGLPDPGRFVPVDQQLLDHDCAARLPIPRSYFVDHARDDATLHLKAGTDTDAVPCATLEAGFRCTFHHETERLPDFDAVITIEEQAELWFESADAGEVVHAFRTLCHGEDCDYLATPFEREFEQPLPCATTRWLRIVRR